MGGADHYTPTQYNNLCYTESVIKEYPRVKIAHAVKFYDTNVFFCDVNNIIKKLGKIKKKFNYLIFA